MIPVVTTLKDGPSCVLLSDAECSKVQFDAWARSYDHGCTTPYFARCRQWVVEAITPYLTEEDTILDVGCGTGSMVLDLANLGLGARVIGLDLSENMVRIAETKRGDTGYGEPAAFMQGEACRLPLKDNSVSVAVCVNSFHHFDKALDEFRRVIRKGGLLVILENYRDGLARSAWTKIIKTCYREPYVRYYTRRELAETLRSYGFSTVEQRRFLLVLLLSISRKI